MMMMNDVVNDVVDDDDIGIGIVRCDVLTMTLIAVLMLVLMDDVVDVDVGADIKR